MTRFTAAGIAAILPSVALVLLAPTSSLGVAASPVKKRLRLRGDAGEKVATTSRRLKDEVRSIKSYFEVYYVVCNAWSSRRYCNVCSSVTQPYHPSRSDCY